MNETEKLLEEKKEESYEGCWSDVADSDEMKAFIDKNFKFDYKSLGVLVIFFIAAVWMLISGHEEESSLAQFVPYLTDKVSDSVITIAAGIIVFIVIMFMSRGKKYGYQEGIVKSIALGAASNPETKGTLIGGRIQRYDIRVEETKSGRIRIMDTTDKEIASMYKPGMKVRYHEAFDFIEKYDKSDDTILVCPHCKRKNSTESSHCFYCGCPLLK